MPTYEYLVVVGIASRKDDSDGNQIWSTTYEFWWPNAAEPEKRLAGWSSPFAPIINDLGQDGWKLITETALDTVIFADVYGWSEVACPVRQRWIFMREARS